MSNLPLYHNATSVQRGQQGINFEELTDAEIPVALDEAEERGVRGGCVHDWLHAREAMKAGVALLLTDNFAGFAGLEDDFTIAVRVFRGLSPQSLTPR